MKSIFKNNYCFVSYPNLIIAQLEESSIREKKNRSYERFKWNKDKYLSYKSNNNAEINFKKINEG